MVGIFKFIIEIIKVICKNENMLILPTQEKRKKGRIIIWQGTYCSL